MSIRKFGTSTAFILALLPLFILYTPCALSINNDADQQNYRSAIDTSTPIAEDINEEGFKFEEIVSDCNASFTIPMDYIKQFNETGELPNTAIDKTGMCFLRCYMEKSGLLRNWKLNRSLVRQTMWPPATEDSIPICEKEGAGESCMCRHAYAIAKCVMKRAIADARRNN